MHTGSMRFYFITNNPAMAEFVCAHGVDRVFVDLEIIGKQERQGHLNTVISRHTLEDVANVRAVVPPGALMVRVNPVNDGSLDEINALVQMKVDTLMLPMFHALGEASTFVEMVDGRARTCLLAETVGSIEAIEELAPMPGVDEIHFGLNDLHLELRCRFMFEPLASGYIDRAASIMRAAGKPFGIGGVARVGEGLLPAELLLGEHARLGSSGAILSRTFHRQAATVQEIQKEMNFGEEIAKLRREYELRRLDTVEALNELHATVQRLVADIVAGEERELRQPGDD